MKHDPGFIIGLATIVGSITAALGVRRGAVHKLIPLPALSYLVTTTLAGAVHDRGVLNDTKEYVTNFLTWIGGAFLAVVWATVLVVVIALARWLLSKRLVSGNLSAGGRPSARRPGGRAPGSPPSDSWAAREVPPGRDAADPRDPRGGGRSEQGSWSDRGPRDPRGGRDPRGERGSREGWQGTRANPGGDRGRRPGMDARDPWAAVDRLGDWDQGQRGDRGPRRDDRGPRSDGRGRSDRDQWGGAGSVNGSGNGSGNGHRNPTNRGNPGNGRDPRADWGQWGDGSRRGGAQGQRRYGDSRDSRDPRDARRPRPADGPRNAW